MHKKCINVYFKSQKYRKYQERLKKNKKISYI